MAEGPDVGAGVDGAKNILSKKIGPLPLIVWVGIGAGAIALLIAYRGKMGKSTGSPDLLSILESQSMGLQSSIDHLQSQDNNIGTTQVQQTGQMNAMSDWADRVQIIHNEISVNPSLLDPAYQHVLVQSRGWVFWEGEPHTDDGLPIFPFTPAPPQSSAA